MPYKDPEVRRAHAKEYGRTWRKRNRASQNRAHDEYRRRNLKKFSLKATLYINRMWERDPARARMKVRLRELRSRCRCQGVPYDLAVGDLVVPTHCPVLGIPLLDEKGGKRAVGGRKENSASIDRIRPELGYVRGNVRVISWRANRLRNDATIAELEKIVAYMRGLGLDPNATSPFAVLPERSGGPEPSAATTDQATSPSGSQLQLLGPLPEPATNPAS